MPGHAKGSGAGKFSDGPALEVATTQARSGWKGEWLKTDSKSLVSMVVPLITSGRFGCIIVANHPRERRTFEFVKPGQPPPPC